MDDGEEPRRLVLVCLTVCVVTFLALSSSLGGGFTGWDDNKFILENERIRSLSPSSVIGLFTSFHSGYFSQPMVLLSFALEYRLFGIDPFYYHLTNLLLHTAVTALVFFLVRSFSGSTLAAMVAALFFGVHPLHVESVAWVSGRKDLLATFFYLSSFLLYIGYKQGRGIPFYVFSMAAFLAALFSKSTAVSLPVVLVLGDYLAGRPFTRRSVLSVAPYFALSAAFAAITVFIHGKVLTPVKEFDVSFFERLLVGAHNIVFYIFKTVLPLNLSVIYPYPEKVSIAMPEYFMSVLAVVVATAFVINSARYGREVLFGTLFFVLTVLPVLKIVQFPSGAVAADRYMYIPSIGLFYLVGIWVQRLMDSRPSVRGPLLGAVALVVVVFSVMSSERCTVWRSSLTLWSDGRYKYPESAMIRYNLGAAYYDGGMVDKAMKEYEETVRLEPTHNKVHNNIGVIYLERGEAGRAREELEYAVILSPESPDVRTNLGNAWLGLGRPGLAEKFYREAIGMDPDFADAYLNLGNIFDDRGDMDGAEGYYMKALSLDPVLAEAYNSLGTVYGRRGELERAVKAFEDALRLKPDLQDAAYNLDKARAMLGNR